MSVAALPASYFIGWDVGAWNCEGNSKSRDAIVILDSSRSIVGKPWRATPSNHLRNLINESKTTDDWIESLFNLCDAAYPGKGTQYVLAIDTPLGFSDTFVRLVSDRIIADKIEGYKTNPYLFRQTERFLIEHGLMPLSAVTHMIGNQATKGMHALAKFAPNIQSCGVWTDTSDDQQLTAIEAYPAACIHSAIIRKLRENFQSLGHEDKDDALTCALLASLFAKERKQLASPDDSASKQEGWIWVPTDGVVG